MPIPSGARYRLGSLEVAVVSDGTLQYDAGAIFGVVPRVMWERVAGPLDSMHRMTLGLNCLLVRSEGRTVLVESGVGGKPGDRDNASPAEDGTLLTSLAALGVAAEDVTDVVNTHLHSDHCGWNTTGGGNGGTGDEDPLRPTFPNATYHIATTEWHDANHPNERTRATYLERNLAPIESHVRLLDGDGAETPITSEVRFLAAPGHTEGHGVIVLGAGQDTAVFTGDLAQHRVQLERTAWVSGLDVLPLVSMETKKLLMDRCIDEQALVLVSHVAYPGAMRMARTERGFRQLLDVPPDA